VLRVKRLIDVAVAASIAAVIRRDGISAAGQATMRPFRGEQ
jgi:hypothetical protein